MYSWNMNGEILPFHPGKSTPSVSSCPVGLPNKGLKLQAKERVFSKWRS